MENYGSIDSSTSGDLSAICESAADPPDPPSGKGEQATLIDVAICIDDSLGIQDCQNLTCDLIASHVEDGTFSLAKETISDDCLKLTCDLISSHVEDGTFSLAKETISDDCQKLTCDLISLHVEDGTFSLAKETISDDCQKLTRDLISSHVEDGTFSLVKETISNDCFGTKIRNASSKKCLDKCVAFPCSSKETGDTSAASAHSCLRSASLPSTLKLVSALKGSREKLGTSPRKLSVTWAPDVYDPVPTSVSHVPTNKSRRHHRSDGKKNGRSKQKGGGKSSHGSSRSKDKKPARKVVGGSSRSYKALVDDFPKDLPGAWATMADFTVGRADALCGSSFLKKSVAQLPFPVTEAA